jgi:spore coat-associated protein N
MKAGLIALFVIGLVAIGVGAQTWAYFSDTETSSGNYIEAGTLDLTVNGALSVTQSVDEGDGVAPGDSGTQYIAVRNAGTVNGHLYVTISNVQVTENTPGTVNSGTWDIRDAVILTIYDTAGNAVITDTLSNLENQQLNLGSLNPTDDPVQIRVDWQIDSNADNGIQGDSVTFDMNFELDQS